MQGLLTNYSIEILFDMLYDARSTNPFPATLYLGAFTSAIDANGSGTEVSGNGYARITVAFTTATGNSRSNNAEVSFPLSTGTWGTVSHFGLFDASTGGNVLCSFAIPTNQVTTITINNQIDIPQNDLTVSFGGGFTNYTRNRLLQNFVNNGSNTFPSTLYLGLFTSSISDTGTGTEVNDPSYVRVTVNMTDAGNTRQNTNRVEFPAFSSTNSYNISNYAVIDASTSGNVLSRFSLTQSETFTQGGQPRFEIGNITQNNM